MPPTTPPGGGSNGNVQKRGDESHKMPENSTKKITVNEKAVDLHKAWHSQPAAFRVRTYYCGQFHTANQPCACYVDAIICSCWRRTADNERVTWSSSSLRRTKRPGSASFPKISNGSRNRTSKNSCGVANERTQGRVINNQHVMHTLVICRVMTYSTMIAIVHRLPR